MTDHRHDGDIGVRLAGETSVPRATGMVGTLARCKSEYRLDRVRRALLRNAEAGKNQGGPARYGYTTAGGSCPRAAIVAEPTPPDFERRVSWAGRCEAV